jgi:hypothetical protein
MIHGIALMVTLSLAGQGIPPTQVDPVGHWTAAGSKAPGAFGCKVAADCVNSCRHGAVSRTWYRTHYPGGERCKDGCTSKGTEAPRCVAQSCVAYYKGKPSATCTRRQVKVLPGPGPAHQCTSAAQCMNSCLFGALNARWYQRHTWHKRLDQRCEDGCASKFHGPPRCEERMCTAYLRSTGPKTKPRKAPGCTGVPVTPKRAGKP